MCFHVSELFSSLVTHAEALLELRCSEYLGDSFSYWEETLNLPL